MKQIQLSKPGGLDKLQLVETNIPSIGDNEILVKVAFSSLNYHDLLVALGSIPTEDKRVLLGDASGEVVQIGDSVSKWEVGDQIMSVCFPKWIEGQPKRENLSFIGDNEDGYATEYIALPETAVTKIPQGWSPDQVATLPCAGLTAWRALVDKGNLQAGETVLIQGTGGVSIFALQLAKSMGAKVIATSSSHKKLEKLKALGADELINYKETPKWGKEVKIKTNNEGVDHVVEVGGGDTFSQSIIATKLGGHIAMIGVLSGTSAKNIILPKIFLKQIRTSGIAMGNQQSQIAMVEYLEKSDIKPIISDTFDLIDLTNAFKHLMEQNHFGKISIKMI